MLLIVELDGVIIGSLKGVKTRYYICSRVFYTLGVKNLVFMI